MHSHLSGDMTKNYVAVLEPYPKGRIRQVLDNLTLHLNRVFLAHTYFTGRPAPLKLAFFKRLSYWWVMM